MGPEGQHVRCDVIVERSNGDRTRCCARAQWELNAQLRMCSRHRRQSPMAATAITTMGLSVRETSVRRVTSRTM